MVIIKGSSITNIISNYLYSTLQNCHQQLHFDLSDKSSALDIDSGCVQLDNVSTNIALQTDPTRIKKG